MDVDAHESMALIGYPGRFKELHDDYLKFIDNSVLDFLFLPFFRALFGQLLPGFIYGEARATDAITFMSDLTKTSHTRK